MNECGWGWWEGEVILGPKGIHIVSLKTSMSASQTDHLGHCVALNQLQRQRGKQGKVIKLEKGKLLQELLSNEPHQREKVVCIGFRIMKKEDVNRTPLPAVNKYLFNGECTSSFLSNYCSILKPFPMAMMSRRRNMPTNTRSSGNTLGAISLSELLAYPNTWDVLGSHLRTSGFSGLVFIMAVSVMADSQDGLAETLRFQSMWNSGFCIWKPAG